MRRAIKMFTMTKTPILGLVENMSHFVCPTCQEESDLFGKGGGEAAASEMAVPFLGRIPIYLPIREGGDNGRPIVVAEPDSPASQAFLQLAERAAAQVSIAAINPVGTTVS